MKYFFGTDGLVYAFEDDGSQDQLITEGMIQLSEAEKELHLNPKPTHDDLASIEDQWREEQMSRVATQLLMLEDEDPDAEPGTARQWRDYRIELRKWVEGNADFPNKEKRPVAPSS